MGRYCSVCNHPQVAEINRAIAKYQQARAARRRPVESLKDIARRFGVSYDALRRHVVSSACPKPEIEEVEAENISPNLIYNKAVRALLQRLDNNPESVPPHTLASLLSQAQKLGALQAERDAYAQALIDWVEGRKKREKRKRRANRQKAKDKLVCPECGYVFTRQDLRYKRRRR